MDDEYRDADIPERMSLADAMFVNPQRYKSFFTKRIRERLVDDIGLTESTLFFVIVLDDEVGMSLKDLSAYVGVDKALTTRVVKYMLSLGYITKEKCIGHEYSVKLTEKGLEARKKGKEIIREISDYLMADLTPEEIHVMDSVVAKVVKRMESYR